MYIAIIFFLATLIIGPLAFWFFSTIYYKHERHLRFPTSVKGSVGDTIMLPLFNARVAYIVSVSGFALFVNSIRLAIALILLLFISSGYFYYRGYIYPKLYGNSNWMKGEDSFFNGLGWYHFGYFVLQTFIILGSLLFYPNDVWLWTFLFGYIVTAFVAHFQLKKKVI